MTVAELIAAIDVQYPNGETSATKVMYMNLAQTQLQKYFKNYRHISILTVAGQDEYAFPLGVSPIVCTDVDQIVSLGLSNAATPANRYDYEKLDRLPYKNYPQSGRGFFQTYNSDGDKKLVLYPAPVASDLIISILFDKPFEPLSAGTTSAIPEVPVAYHDLLVVFACARIAAIGSAPDKGQAAMFGGMFADGVNELEMDNLFKEAGDPDIIIETPQWRKNRRHASGGAEVGT